ncbi:response regulator [Euzebya sp.]|uniref:response regulator n=1 Tax=Euzebya sp. TaxID=1971409 RepID=UPI00351851A7
MPRDVEAQILLVEDNPGDVLMVTQALSHSEVPNRVHVARDGAEALDFAFQRGVHADAPRPDLVFLDINLPKVDGHEVLAMLKDDEDLRTIPVVMLTSSDAESDVRAAYRTHVNAYLTKGFDFAELEAVLRESLHYWIRRVRHLQA